MNIFSPYKRFVGSFLPNCLLQYTGLNPLEKLVWARLAQYMGDSDYCYPKQKTLAYELGVTVKSVRRALSVLEEEEFLKVERPNSAAKMNRFGNKYYFLENSIFLESEDSRPSGVETTPDKNDEPTLKTKSIRTKRSGVVSTPVESKRIKQENQEHKKSAFLDLFPKKFQQDTELVSAWQDFVQFRKEEKKKPLSQLSAKRIIEKLVKHEASAIEMINTSIENGWTGVFPPKSNSKQIKPGHVPRKQVYGKPDEVWELD